MAIAATLLTSGTDPANATGYSTASVSPAANALLVLDVYSCLSSGTYAPPSSVVGNGLTWVAVLSAGTGLNGLTRYRAMGAAPSAGALSISFGASQLACSWVLGSVTGVKTTGANGADAVAQSGIAENTDVAITVALAAFVGAGNGTYFGAGHRLDQATTLGAGLTSLADVAGSSPLHRICAGWTAGNDLSPDAAWANSANNQAIAMELAEASSGTAYTASPADPLGLTDNVSRAAGYERTTVESETLIDLATRAGAAARSSLDVVGLTDSMAAVIGVQAHTRAPIDAIGLTDSMTAIALLDVTTQSVAESAGIGDTVTITHLGPDGRPLCGPVADRAYAALGPLADGDRTTGWHLYHLVCAAVKGLVETESLIRDTEAGPGWSSLLDIGRAPATALGWLAQLVGVDLLTGLSDAAQRQRIAETPGFARGTLGSIEGAARQTLSGAQQVLVYERDVSAYHLTVRTYAAETPDPVHTEAVLRALKPAGLVLVYQLAAGATYGQLDVAWTSYGSIDLAFDDYAAQTLWVP